MKILIIGATSGIGRALCVRYSNAGNEVVATGRRSEFLNELERTQQGVSGVAMDVTDVASTCEKISQIWNEHRQIDLAIVCAGVGDLNPKLIHEINEQAIRTNVVGWTNVVDCIYHHFETQGHGHLVTITSLSALRGEPIAPAYSASKAYQQNYTEALCKKAYKQEGKIIVSEIRPGLVKTAMAKGEGLFWMVPVDTAAKQIANAVARCARITVVSKRWRIIAFILKHVPWWMYKRM